MDTSYYFFTPFEYRIDKKDVPGILCLSRGTLSFYSKETTIECGNVKDLNVQLGGTSLTVTSQQNSYNFKKASFGHELTKELMQLLPSETDVEQDATHQLIKQTNRQDLLVLYEDGKFTNEMWLIILKASGAQVDPASFKVSSRPSVAVIILFSLGVAVLVALIIALRIYTTH